MIFQKGYTSWDYQLGLWWLHIPFPKFWLNGNLPFIRKCEPNDGEY